jgi:tetratricopeptide (TPR) repeat protein
MFRRFNTLFLIFLISLLILVYEESEMRAQPVPPSQPDVIEVVENGYLAHRRGDYDEAIDYFTQIIKRRGLSPKQRAVTYLLRGESKREKGELVEAIYDFTRALNQWSNYPQAIFFRGQVLVQLNRLEEALVDLTRAVELDPDRESYQTNLSLLRKKMKDLGLSLEVRSSTLEIKIPQE